MSSIKKYLSNEFNKTNEEKCSSFSSKCCKFLDLIKPNKTDSHSSNDHYNEDPVNQHNTDSTLNKQLLPTIALIQHWILVLQSYGHKVLFYACFWKAVLKAATAKSTSSFVMHIGGLILNTWNPGKFYFASNYSS